MTSGSDDEGREMGPVEAMGHCVRALEALLSILVLSCSRKASSFINCCFLLGGENPPILVHFFFFVFSLCSSAKSPGCLFALLFLSY